MQITSGSLKYRKIDALYNSKLRPTSNKIRQALFNILINRYDWNNWCHKAHLLDAFSGSGIITIEGFSRKLFSATLIEEDPNIFKILEENFTKLELIKKAQLINENFFDVILQKKAYDIVYLDPPYRFDFVNKAIEKILSDDVLKKDALLICETEKNYLYDKNFKKYILSSKNYGKTSITFFNFF